MLTDFDSANGAYEAGALYNWLVGHLAAWPPPTEGYDRQKQREIEHRKQVEMNAANALRVREALESRKQAQQLDDLHGPDLDAMPRERVIEMIREISPKGAEFYLAKLPSKPPWAFTARSLLIENLARNSAQRQEQDACATTNQQPACLRLH